MTLNREGAIDSDSYAFNDVCGERLQGKDSKTARGLQGVGGDGRLPSGAAGASGLEVGGGKAGVGVGGCHQVRRVQAGAARCRQRAEGWGAGSRAWAAGRVVQAS